MIAVLAPLLLLQASGVEPHPYDAWGECVVREREAFAASTEPAETLATAVLSACSSYERAAYTEMLLRAPKGRGPVYAQQIVTQLVAGAKEDLRQALIEYFVRKRLQQR